MTERGLRPIGEVEPGERVSAFDFETGEWILREVTERHDNLYHGPVVTVDLGVSKIETTVYHPFWVLDGRDLAERSQPRELQPHESEGLSLTGRWVNSHELRAGDIVFGHDRLPHVIQSVSQRFEPDFPVSNLTIADRKSTRLNSSHLRLSRMPSSA